MKWMRQEKISFALLLIFVSLSFSAQGENLSKIGKPLVIKTTDPVTADFMRVSIPVDLTKESFDDSVARLGDDDTMACYETLKLVHAADLGRITKLKGGALVLARGQKTSFSVPCGDHTFSITLDTYDLNLSNLADNTDIDLAKKLAAANGEMITVSVGGSWEDKANTKVGIIEFFKKLFDGETTE